MTRNEFNERTGLNVTENAYGEIEQTYMNTDIDKDLFCELWIKYQAALKEIERKTVLVRELFEERKSLTNFLVEQAEKCSSTDLRSRAISMLGEREYLRRKIERGFNLWKTDKELLNEILKA